MPHTIILAFLLFMAVPGYAQVDGYILVGKVSIDTLWGDLDLAKGLKRQNTVGFRKKASEEFTVYGPDAIIGYGQDRSGHYMSSNFDPVLGQLFLDNLSFLRRIASGTISVFR